MYEEDPIPGESGPVSIVHGLPVIVGETAVVGKFGGSPTPVLIVENGDEVVTKTLGLWGGHATPDHSFDEIMRLREGVAGAGPHTLTGPIEVDGADIGDAIGIEILRVTPGKHGINLVTPKGMSRGLLTDDFAAGYVKHFEIDAEKGVAVSGKISVPIEPFLGFIGVAPAEGAELSSVEPGVYGGNLDVSLAKTGSTVWLPVQREGAFVYLGDGHAAQGGGELNGTAIECGLDLVHVKIHVEKNTQITAPRITDAGKLTSVGLGATLDEAMRNAAADMVEWLKTYGVGASDAYTLCSIVADTRVSQVVNRTLGVHLSIDRALIPQNLLQSGCGGKCAGCERAV